MATIPTTCPGWFTLKLPEEINERTSVYWKPGPAKLGFTFTPCTSKLVLGEEKSYDTFAKSSSVEELRVPEYVLAPCVRDQPPRLSNALLRKNANLTAYGERVPNY